VRDEHFELAYVRIDDALWDEGPAAANAKIKSLARDPEEIFKSLFSWLDEQEQEVVRSDASTILSDPVSNEPSTEPGLVLQVTQRGLEIIVQPLGSDFEENLQKGIHDRLRRLLPSLTDETRKVANRYPALDHVVSEYADLVERPFDQLDVGSMWAVETGLLAYRAAFANQSSGTMTEPLEPGHMALLQQAAEIHGAFILGFPEGRKLNERADQARLSPEIVAQIASPSRRILDDLARSVNLVEEHTRKVLSAIDDSLIIHGWETARLERFQFPWNLKAALSFVLSHFRDAKWSPLRWKML